MVGLIVPELKYVSEILKKCDFEILNKEKQIYKCKYYSKVFYLVITGFDHIDIAISTNYLIKNYQITKIISLGICFALPNSDYDIFDIVLPDKLYKNAYLPSKNLNNQIIKSINYSKLKYHRIEISTTDCFFPSKTNSYVSDLDLSIIAKLAENNQIKYTGIKIMTHFLCCHGFEQYRNYQEIAIKKVQKIYLDFLIIS